LADTLEYTPPPTVKAFIKDYRPKGLFYDWIVGPVGSGKTTGLFFKLCYMAKLQAPAKDGIRRSRAVVVRNTAPQLKDTTLKSWFTWFKDGQAGHWKETEKVFILKFGDVECEVLFRPLDTAQDVQRVLSLELTFAILDEFVQIPQEIVEALSARCGRYPAVKDGGATNWGMWGSSNPETEDNWWFDYLHKNLPSNAQFFFQPSGYAANAENLDYLPGGRGYYDELAKGKSEAWVHQFIEAAWGFSIAGTPVIKTFKPGLHLAPAPLRYNPLLPLIGGLDPGLGGTALILGQETHHGRLNVLGEIITSGVGANRFITDFVKPYLRQHFPQAKLTIAPDPAAANRTQTDEKTVVDAFRKHFPVKIETNNQLSIRIDAIDHFTTRLIEEGPALQIDEARCPILVRALKGGWRYVMDPKNDQTKPQPQKNAYSHPGDAFGYLSRYFHRQVERQGVQTRSPLPLPTRVPYHFR
jgi:hypothetical protein